jgi:hypothetical protein
MPVGQRPEAPTAQQRQHKSMAETARDRAGRVARGLQGPTGLSSDARGAHGGSRRR